MATGSITLHQMLKHPYVLGVFSRLKANGLAFQQFYNMRPESSGTERSDRRSLVYDIFDNTRAMAQARAPMTGPAKIAPKPIGIATAHALRLYEAIPLHYEKIYNIRAMGGQVGPLDKTGRTYVTRQLSYAAQRMANSIEFMVSRMFRGGFSILPQGENFFLRELDAVGAINVEYNIPDSNKLACPAGSGADIFTTGWQDETVPIIDQMLALNAASERQTGYQIRHGWINSITYGYMLGNDQLREVRGTANRIFDTQTGTEITTADGSSRSSGYTVMFGAMPQFLWHVYDGVGNVFSDVDPDPDVGYTNVNSAKFVEDDRAIFTPEPEPGSWYGMATCAEPVRKKGQASGVTIAEGLNSWEYPTDDPPGTELRVLHNLVPLLYVPKAIYYAKVANP